MEHVRTGVVEESAAWPEEESAVRVVLSDAVLGRRDAAWLSALRATAPDVSTTPHGLPRLLRPPRLEGHAGPADFLAEPATLTPERIRQEENAELRRVMPEHYGYDRYLAESGAQPVHRDGTGVLWRIDLEDGEPVLTVEVVNSTPEPDGTYRTYGLRVPPGTRTARESVARTFGLGPDAYELLVQT